MIKKNNEQGTVLIIVTVLTMVLLAIVGAHLTMSSIQSRGAEDAALRKKCQAVLHAAVARSIHELNLNNAVFDDLNAPPFGTADNPTSFGNGCYYVEAEDLGDGNKLLRAYAGIAGSDPNDLYNTAKFKMFDFVTANATPILLPDPTPTAALEINGNPDKMKGFKLHDDTGDNALISGFDNGSAGENLLGISIESSQNVFDKFMKDILNKDKIDWSRIITGDPMVTYEGKKGPVDVSVDRTASSGFDHDFFADLTEAIAERIENDLIPNADITEKKLKIESDTTWGTPDDPKIVYITKDLKIDKNATVTGYGTLILEKKLNLHHASLNWYGTILITGGTNKKPKGGELHQHQGSLYVEGAIVLLGSGKGKTKLHIHNNDKKEVDPTTVIKGAILAFSGREDKKDKVDIKFHHTEAVIDGLIAAAGDKIKLDLKAHKGRHKHNDKWRESSLEIDGAVILAVDDPAKGKTKADIKIDGNTRITWNSDKFKDALDILKKLANGFLPKEQNAYTYNPGVWAPKVE